MRQVQKAIKNLFFFLIVFKYYSILLVFISVTSPGSWLSVLCRLRVVALVFWCPPTRILSPTFSSSRSLILFHLLVGRKFFSTHVNIWRGKKIKVLRGQVRRIWRVVHNVPTKWSKSALLALAVCGQALSYNKHTPFINIPLCFELLS